MKHFVLAGNPNSGKTTLYNALTGSTAHTGNWPGVTVDKRSGYYKKLDENIEIVDLPGIYSLSPYTPEEIVSRNCIVDGDVDCIINVVDVTNLERNLYLTTQILEIDVPVIVALNMSDVIYRNGDSINISLLEEKLGVPVIEVSALKGTNLDELMLRAFELSKTTRKGTIIYKENNPLYHLIRDVEIAFKGQKLDNPLFHAVKLVENDKIEVNNHPDSVNMVDEFKATFENDTFGQDFEALVADARYKYVSNDLYKVFVKNKKRAREEKDLLKRSERIDKVMTHKFWAIPIFIFIMFMLFHLTFGGDLFFLGKMGLHLTDEIQINFFTGMGYESLIESGETFLEGIPSIGVFLQNWMIYIFNSLTGLINDGFEGIGSGGTWYASLITDGVFSGVGAVLSFVPQILLLFLFLSILEDSGYMARVAFILDRAFRKFGLSGKAIVPMLTGFGCSVPAIMATRTIENEKEKNRTIRLLTCFSCGAKTPIWALLANVGVMVGLAGDLFVFSIYLVGILLAIALAFLMKLFDKNHRLSPFILELPSYHMPQAKNVIAHLWDKLKHYLIKAGTVILVCLMVIWFLRSFGVDGEGKFAFLGDDIENSMLAYLGRGLRYFFYPMGWSIDSINGWKYSVATITGLIAKEDVVGTLDVLGLNAETISLSVHGVYAFAFFNLLTFPCMSAISTAYAEQTKKEFGKTLLFYFGVSYIFATIVYWLGALCEYSSALGSIVIIAIVMIIAIISIINIKQKSKSDKPRCCC